MATAFSNSMEDGNQLNDESPNAGASDDRPSNMGSRDLPVTAGKIPAAPSVDYPLPIDPHCAAEASETDSAEVSDLGLNERVEVGISGPQSQYGLK